MIMFTVNCLYLRSNQEKRPSLFAFSFCPFFGHSVEVLVLQQGLKLMLPSMEARVLSIGISIALSAFASYIQFHPKALILLQPRGAEIFVPSINCFTHSPQRNALYMVLVAGDKHWKLNQGPSFPSCCSGSFSSFSLLTTFLT